jgi:hypothetical protein
MRPSRRPIVTVANIISVTGFVEKQPDGQRMLGPLIRQRFGEAGDREIGGRSRICLRRKRPVLMPTDLRRTRGVSQ